MAGSAEALPVIAVPKAHLITAMRDNMIHHGRGDGQALALAFGTERMPSEISRPRLLPAGAITALVTGIAPGIIGRILFLPMLFAIGLRRPIVAAGIVAGAMAFHRAHNTVISTRGCSGSF